MSGDEDKTDKQFDATEQKLGKAREKGDFPRSTEVNSALAYLGALIAAGVAASYGVPGLINSARTLWMGAAQTDANGVEIGGLDTIGRFALPVAGVTMALLTIPAAIILVGLIAQRGIVFVPSKVAPDISRINPIKNIGQKFGKSGLVTFAISLAKASSVAVGGWALFQAAMPVLLQGRETSAWVNGLWFVGWRTLALALAISAVFAIVDLGWKHYDFRQRNRMSMKEMKDEMKDSEGDPHMKSARRQKSMEIVLSSMLADVETADVVIVNPTHYAVALKWQRGSGSAPICVAKGVDEIAQRIRERAKKNQVPIWSDPPCARSIHASVNIGAEIDAEHFAAVAAAIRFSEVIRKKVQRGW